ncbi:hypothetical protein BDM02DRAFT_2253157 [Thelephora ganbajun]|uniref:Uncharacterized protein n=1 Tax=Thelephora ganbajun TaxID=370292 RepID=A0ACB6ZFX4_THEGA|nr:hypothetical protein BDM02DRAFT_2253157 [Thelephora ganbajun]
MLIGFGLFLVPRFVQRFEWARSCWESRFHREFQFQFGFVCNFWRRCVLCWVSFFFSCFSPSLSFSPPPRIVVWGVLDCHSVVDRVWRDPTIPLSSLQVPIRFGDQKRNLHLFLLLLCCFRRGEELPTTPPPVSLTFVYQ